MFICPIISSYGISIISTENKRLSVPNVLSVEKLTLVFPPFLTIFSKFLISFPVNILATFCLPLENFFMEVNFFTWTNKVYKD